MLTRCVVVVFIKLLEAGLVQKVQAFLRFVLNNFGPLVVFYAVNHFFGLKPAIGASTVFTLAEIGTRYFRKQSITGIFLFTAVLTLVFGGVDLCAQQSFLFQYESVATSLFMAAFFGATLVSEKSIIQDYYEKSGNSKPLTRDKVAYFRILTGVWVFYFLVKAVAYFWVARNYSLEQGLAIRTVLGSGSLYLMLFLSIVGSKKLFPLMKQLRLLPDGTEPA